MELGRSFGLPEVVELLPPAFIVVDNLYKNDPVFANLVELVHKFDRISVEQID